jgi:hypothetical protein
MSIATASLGKPAATTSWMKSSNVMCLTPFPNRYDSMKAGEPRGVPRMLMPSSEW